MGCAVGEEGVRQASGSTLCFSIEALQQTLPEERREYNQSYVSEGMLPRARLGAAAETLLGQVRQVRRLFLDAIGCFSPR